MRYHVCFHDIEMTGSTIDDPRLRQPLCEELQPVETVHQNPWFVVRNRGGYFTTEYHATQVAVLAVVDHRAIVLVRVKRPVIADTPYELPAGAAQGDESPADTAARELLEETGIGPCDPSRFILEPPIAVSSNRSPVMPHVFRVALTQAEYDARGQHDCEIQGVELHGFGEIRRMIAESRIYIGLAVAILARCLFRDEVAGS